MKYITKTFAQARTFFCSDINTILRLFSRKLLYLSLVEYKEIILKGTQLYNFHNFPLMQTFLYNFHNFSLMQTFKFRKRLIEAQQMSKYLILPV